MTNNDTANDHKPKLLLSYLTLGRITYNTIVIIHLVENHGECEDERLVFARLDTDIVRVLSTHLTTLEQAAHPVDLRNVVAGEDAAAAAENG